MVQILLVDVGTKVEKDMQDLCYLVDDPNYKIEHFAVLASLHNVEPPLKLKSWPMQSITKFSELAFSGALLAEYSDVSNVRAYFVYISIVILKIFHFH
jgi:hypothetical protein